MSATNPTVAEYAVARIAALGIGHVFGLPGDFSFPINDAIEDHPELEWILSSNELNAAYSADGYARVHGAGMLTTTFGVGELSALNGQMGCMAERLPVFHLVGAPSSRIIRARRVMHHSLGDGRYDHFSAIMASASCAHAVLDPGNAISELERVIDTALRERRPAYLLFPEDYARMLVLGTIPEPYSLQTWRPPTSEPGELKAALALILERLAKAKKPVILPTFTLARYGMEDLVDRLLQKTGIPFATGVMDKSVLGEGHPSYIGSYRGDFSRPEVRAYVEEADLILDLGGLLFDDLSTGFSSSHLSRERFISVQPTQIVLGENGMEIQSYTRSFSPVWIRDVLEGLLSKAPTVTSVGKIPLPAPAPQEGTTEERITFPSLRTRIQSFLREGDLLVAETGTSSLQLSSILLPKDARYLNQSLWGSIGWATPATLGICLAAPDRRVILVTGDGSHQLTATEIGIMGKYGVKPIILVANNRLFGIEEFLESNASRDYNRIAQWRYADLPTAMGCDGWFTTIVHTNAELEEALNQARQGDTAAYIEVDMGEPLLAPLPPELLAKEYQLEPPKA
jgi:indolepyruvate decarboxylase